MDSFCETQNINFIKVCVTLAENGKKKIDYPLGWQKFDKTECQTYNENKKKHNMYALLFTDKKNILCFDTDSEIAYYHLKTILKKLNLYDEKNITDSFSCRKKGLTFKKHFYFSVGENLNMVIPTEKKTGVNLLFPQLDMFYCKGNVLEFTNSTVEAPIFLSNKQFKEIREYLAKNTPKDESESEPEAKPKIESDSESEAESEEEPPKDVKKKAKTTRPNINKIDFDTPTQYDDETLKKILSGLKKKRFEEYNNWLIIAMIFVNENFDLAIFDEICEKYKNYDKANNENIFSKLKKNQKKGYSISTLFFWLKEDNKKIYDELNKKRFDIWNLLINFNQNDVAKLYYNMNPHKYIKCSIDGWFEYEENNTLYNTVTTPSSILNNIGDKIQEIILETRNTLKPDDKFYDQKNKLIKSAYKNMGTNKFIHGVIDFLNNYYIVKDLHKKIDGNRNLIAFKNKLFDLEKKEFRAIQPTDYIKKTIKYDVNEKSDPKIRETINNLLMDIFGNNNMVEYYKYVIGTSLFGNVHQYLYIHTGTGANGKSLLGSLIAGAFCDYFYNCDNDFLTNTKGGPNSSLINCRGKRFISIQEPQTDYFNTEFIKSITGESEITGRELYKNNVTFDILFTPHLQCNMKPKINKIDGGITRRIKIIPYLNKFVDNPKLPNEKKKDINLKDKILNKNVYSEFMLMMFESVQKYATINLNDDFTPPEVKKETEAYIEDNNPIKFFFDNYLTVTGNNNDKIKASELYQLYSDNIDEPILSNVKFATAVQTNGIIKEKTREGTAYIGLRIK